MSMSYPILCQFNSDMSCWKVEHLRCAPSQFYVSFNCIVLVLIEQRCFHNGTRFCRDEVKLTNVGRILEAHGTDLLGSTYTDPIGSFNDFYQLSVQNPEVGKTLNLVLSFRPPSLRRSFTKCKYGILSDETQGHESFGNTTLLS